MISLVNEYTVLIDACVLIPISLADLLLRLAEDPPLYSPRWSPDILVEIERNLTSPPFHLHPDKARYRIACMESAFPEALVTGYESIVENMTNHENDRHILAAAVVGKCNAILTSNSKDFPVKCLEPFGIERLLPDDFLVHQWHLDNALVERKVWEQAEDAKRTVHSLIALLGKMVPRFAALVRASM